MSSKRDEARRLLGVLSDPLHPVTAQVERIAKEVPCGIATVWRALDDMRKDFLVSKEQEKKHRKDEVRQLQKKAKTKEHEVVAVIPKAQWQAFEEFVGYRGYKDATGIHVDHSFHLEKLIINNQLHIERVWNHPYHPGEAIPEPVDETTGEEIGILWYQLQGFRFIEENDNVLILWPRGHGKTWLLAWYIEWCMKHSTYKCMYLSITDVINDVADWVFDWADANGLLASGQKKSTGSKTVRRDTPVSFNLKNGSKFKIFSVKDKKIRGKHGYTIFMDDVVEEGSQTHPSYQLELQRRWNKTISKMRRNKLIIVNTRVYQGDFIEYLMVQFDKKFQVMQKARPQDANRWKLHVDIKTPYLHSKDKEWYIRNNYSESVMPPFGEADIEGLVLHEDKRVLIAPELYTHEHFEAMQAEDLESFMAEMMQDPTPLSGKRWKSVKFKDQIKDMHEYDLMFYYIDRATTTNDTSDYTGWLQGLREKAKQRERNGPYIAKRLIINDFTDHITMEELMYRLSKDIDLFHRRWSYISIIIIIEKQGGGDDFYASIQTRSEFEHEGKKIKNYIRECAIVHPETSTGDKGQRIRNRLGGPLDNYLIRFLKSLQGSMVVKQVLDHPYNDKIDALDALSFDFYIMRDFPPSVKGWIQDLVEVFHEHDKRKLEGEFGEKIPGRKEMLHNLFKRSTTRNTVFK